MKKDDRNVDEKVQKLVEYSMKSGKIDVDLYAEYDVKRGLRDSSGKGVLTGLTEISDVVSFGYIDGEKVPIDGELYYQELMWRIWCAERQTAGLLLRRRPICSCSENFPPSAASGIYRYSGNLPGTSGYLCAGCYHESAQFQYDEYAAEMCADDVFL